MNKPTQKELNELLTTVQVHSQMGDWVIQKRQKSLFIKTLFNDGTFLIEEFEPSQKEVFYRIKWEDNEQYSVMVDIPNKYDYQKEASLGKTSIIKREIYFMKEKGLIFTSVDVVEGV